MATLAAWKQNTTILLVDLLPGQSYESAFAIVEDYLEDVGGWVPDNAGDPTGNGHPASELEPDEAAFQIASDQLDTVYDADLTLTITVKVRPVHKLAPDLTSSAAIATMQPDIVDWLQRRLNDSTMPMEFVSLVSVAGSIANVGALTAAQRVALNTALSATKLIDMKAVALKYARDRYTLDSTWNVSYLYVEDDNPVNVVVEKYTDTTYVTLDPAVTDRYVLSVSPETHTVVAGAQRI